MEILKIIVILLEVLLFFNLMIVVHELGHFLLRWRHHPDRGLMQPTLHASTLIALRPIGFELTAMERARLDIATADWRLADAASCAIAAGTIAADPR